MDVDIEDFETSVDDEDNLQLTSAELIKMLEEVWINEKFAPEILPNKQEVVDCVLGQINYMEKNIETLPSTDLKKGIHQLEVDRIRFMVTSYLRNRVEKIEVCAFHILKQEEERLQRGEEQYLTEGERQFATNYKQGLEQHLENATNFCTGLPLDEWRTQPITPNMHSFVFLKAKNAVEGVVIDGDRGDDVVDLQQNSQMIMSYSSVSNLVKNGDVRLI